jgi:hypothetical protein
VEELSVWFMYWSACLINNIMNHPEYLYSSNSYTF